MKTYLRRGELFNSCTPFAGRAALNSETRLRLKHLDKDLELYDIDGRLCLYKVRSRGGCPSDDLLVFQTVYPYANAVNSIVDWLHERDLWHRHGTALAAKRKVINNMEQHTKNMEESQDKKVSEISRAVAEETAKYSTRKSVILG